jgi:beta-glucosidase
VEKAVKSGQLSEERIDNSVQRIGKAKEKLFSSHASPGEDSLSNPPTEVFSILKQNCAQSDSFGVIEEILRKTNLSGGDLPLKPVKEGRNVLIIDDLLSCDFLDRQTPAVTMPQANGYETQLFDSRTLKLVQMILALLFYNYLLEVILFGVVLD